LSSQYNITGNSASCQRLYGKRCKGTAILRINQPLPFLFSDEMTDYVAFFCNFGVEYNFDVMRTFRFLLLSACCGWSVVTFAQRYELEEVKAGRYEVTNRLDARPDSGAVRVVAPYRHAVDSMMSPVLGESEVAMRADRPESLLSNFVADVLREGSLRVGKMADIGLCNIGGLRSTMPKGDVWRCVGNSPVREPPVHPLFGRAQADGADGADSCRGGRGHQRGSSGHYGRRASFACRGRGKTD